jgi:hypothetical protein
MFSLELAVGDDDDVAVDVPDAGGGARLIDWISARMPPTVTRSRRLEGFSICSAMPAMTLPSCHKAQA